MFFSDMLYIQLDPDIIQNIKLLQKALSLCHIETCCS